VPDDLGFFFEMIANDYLPYLEANARAVAEGASDVSHRAQGVAWEIPTAPYRAQCFNELERRYGELDTDAGLSRGCPAEAVATVRSRGGAVWSRTTQRRAQRVPGWRGRAPSRRRCDCPV